MKYQYKRVELKTEKDFKVAEKLKENGWRIIGSSIFAIIFEKECL
jgi:hypothetical protein